MSTNPAPESEFPCPLCRTAEPPHTRSCLCNLPAPVGDVHPSWCKCSRICGGDQ